MGAKFDTKSEEFIVECENSPSVTTLKSNPHKEKRQKVRS
jgi:hypothetical protein